MKGSTMAPTRTWSASRNWASGEASTWRPTHRGPERSVESRGTQMTCSFPAPFQSASSPLRKISSRPGNSVKAADWGPAVPPYRRKLPSLSTQ